jgi:uncharacterized protein (TIGR03437 family)
MTTHRAVLWLLLFSAVVPAATFGTITPVVGGVVDMALDNPRQRLYLVGVPNKVDVYSIAQRRVTTSIRVDDLPLSAASSRDGRFLYVACHNASSLNIIDLEALAVSARISLPARPEGVAVGADGRVLITTIGTGANNAQNTLLVYDPTVTSAGAELRSLSVTPPPPQPPNFTPPAGRTFLVNRSQLQASADGRFIVGININSIVGAGQRAVFVYETASGTVLRSRLIQNSSSVLSVSADGGRFMAGLSLLESSSLAILAQNNLANAPFPVAAGTNFNLQQSQGGSIFAPDGSTIYSAFNTAPVTSPASRANISQLFLNDPDNLLINLAIQLPENLAGKMVITADGANLFAISESGFVTIPVGQLRNSPLAQPESTVAFLANDQCGVTAAQRNVRVAVRNAGRGRFTANAILNNPAALNTGAGGLVPGGPGGGNPGGPVVILPPIAPVPQPPTTPGNNAQQNNVAAGAPTLRATNTADGTDLTFTFNTTNGRTPGTIAPAHEYIIQSTEAINVPSSVRVLQNNRDTESRGDIVPIPLSTAAGEGLTDLLYDGTRRRVYIANSGLNRIEVYDERTRRLLDPIKVGQLPRSMALSLDGRDLFVANSGSEFISIVNLDTGREASRLRLPNVPFNSGAALLSPSVIAMTVRGPAVIMNNGTLWRVVGDELTPRAVSPVIGSAAITAPRSLTVTPGGETAFVLAGNGTVYLYDALQDDFVAARQIFTGTQLTGFYGAIAAGRNGLWFAANSTVLNSALTPAFTASVNPTTPQPIPALAPGNGNSYLRLSTPVRANANVALTENPTVELVDATTGIVQRRAATLEATLAAVAGTQRSVVEGRTMALDAAGTSVYVLTISGLSIVSLEPVDVSGRGVINPNGVVNLASYQTTLAAGGLISIFGRNLGLDASTSTTALPTVLGGTCVTLNNNPIPLFLTSAGQINAQIPVNLAAGRYPLIVRSVDRRLASVAQTVTVSRYAPAVFADTATGAAIVLDSEGRLVTRSNPTTRDQRLVLYATGLGPTSGPAITTGVPAPTSALAPTGDVDVFFGDPRFSQAAIIVEWSGLAPGFIGLYQINLYVPGDRLRGDALPITVRVGGVSSPVTGPLVPTIAVR